MNGKIHPKTRDLAATSVLLIALGVGAWLVQWQPQALRGQVSAGDGRLYVAEPGESARGESEMLSRMDEYWQVRVTYPTGRFDRRWLVRAAAQDRANVRPDVPSGRVTYNPGASRSPLTLDPTRWTSIGPSPQESNTCQAPCFTFGRVSGRVNDIVIDPISPTVAYFGSDGGGIWKTTNCCTALTTWAAVTDDPLISTVAIGDLSIDPNNHNTVYAATGDFRFGSFSFGSAGVLKSTDQGATWAVKGQDVFGPGYPQPSDNFPQYNAVSRVHAAPTNSNTLIAGTKVGVYFSYNGRDTWTGPCLPDAFPMQRQDITSLLVHTNTLGLSDLYVAVGARGYSTTVQSNLAENGANGIYKTTVPASGCPAAWTLLSRPDNGWPAGTGSGLPVYLPGGNPLGRTDLAMAPGNPNYIYAQVQAILPGVSGGLQRGGQMGLWRTTEAT